MDAWLCVQWNINFFKLPSKTEFGLKNRQFQNSELKNWPEANPRETTFGSKNQEFRKIKGLDNLINFLAPLLNIKNTEREIAGSLFAFVFT